MKELVETIKRYKTEYIGKLFEDTDLDDSIEVILATDDGCDTDLHTCSISNDKGDWIKFYVDVDPASNKILDIDIDCVDYCYGDTYEVVDCVKIDDIKC